MSREKLVVAWIVVVAALTTGPLVAPASAQEVVTATGRGWLETIEQHGQTLSVLHTSGSHYDMGYQHGFLMAEDIVENMQGTLDYIRNRDDYAGDQGRIATQVAQLEAHTPQKYIDEMNGMIAGIEAAGGPAMSYDDLITVQMFAELCQIGCSQFAAADTATKDGHLIHGRNMDWSSFPTTFFHRYPMLHVAQGTGEQAVCNTSFAGFLGVCTGINGAGVSIGTDNCPSSDASYDGVPLTFYLRNALETSTTLDDVTSYIESIPRTCGTNLVVGSGREAGGPKFAAMEVTKTRVVTMTDNDPRENHYWDHVTKISHATRDDPNWIVVSQAMNDALVRTNHFTEWVGDGENLPLLVMESAALFERFVDPEDLISMGFDPNLVMDPNWIMDNAYPEIIIPLVMGLDFWPALVPDVVDPMFTMQRYHNLQGQILDPNLFGQIDPNLAMQMMCSPGIADEPSTHSTVWDSTTLEVWTSYARNDYSDPNFPDGKIIDATSEPYFYYDFGAAIPEPTTMLVLLAGGAMTVTRSRRRG